MHNLTDVAETLRRVRKARHWSQAEIAQAAGVSRVTVARMETQATSDMSLQVVMKLLESAGYELKIEPKSKARAEKQAKSQRSEAVRRYLAQTHSPSGASPLKLEFAYNWSNPNMPDDVLIRKVLEKGRFHDLAVICKQYGLARVRGLAEDRLASSPSLQRSLANIEHGFARAQEHATS